MHITRRSITSSPVGGLADSPNIATEKPSLTLPLESTLLDESMLTLSQLSVIDKRSQTAIQKDLSTRSPAMSHTQMIHRQLIPIRQLNRGIEALSRSLVIYRRFEQQESFWETEKKEPSLHFFL